MLFLIVESDWKATDIPLMPTISPNTFNQSLEIVILLNVVESSGNYVFKDEKSPRDPRANVVSYTLGAYKVFIENVVVETSKGLIQLETERASAFFYS